ncbi:hypothetical protein lacNasYZ03_16840 [Lactobacillus nasalidis]|uniref:Schlafen AlbA-2 domain-containing protein n=1 Tax=Lactobacillus nasalidis TaxID=2797258 RepID=A0ABQ3WAU9_9LACO|nr:hypothetical protein lacNasYZ01_05680 [Lactobacillus nasalidis]GHV99291.1 hypothetical protein lacNasYZ02_07210 [Lactobacillus nasalidis]GHW01997.1 hypothetical protein lacNasYZ03_16840 [Lactobacillus nasalidis]
MRETKNLVFKERVSNTFLKTVSAFANYGTGEIKFGIKDDGEVVGVGDPERVCLDIENKINDSIQPNPKYDLNIDKDSQVITLKVYQGPTPPYFYKSKAYKRNDSASIEVDSVELSRLSHQTLSNWENNRTYPDLVNLLLLVIGAVVLRNAVSQAAYIILFVVVSVSFLLMQIVKRI